MTQGPKRPGKAAPNRRNAPLRYYVEQFPYFFATPRGRHVAPQILRPVKLP